MRPGRESPWLSSSCFATFFQVLSHDGNSRAEFETVRDLSPRVEYYSIDEFFFDASAAPAGDFQSYAVAIRDGLMERVRVPVTVGIARTRIVPWGIRTCLELANADRRLIRQLLTANADCQRRGDVVDAQRRSRPPDLASAHAAQDSLTGRQLWRADR
jgi:hypothetical protein